MSGGSWHLFGTTLMMKRPSSWRGLRGSSCTNSESKGFKRPRCKRVKLAYRLRPRERQCPTLVQEAFQVQTSSVKQRRQASAPSHGDIRDRMVSLRRVSSFPLATSGKRNYPFTLTSFHLRVERWRSRLTLGLLYGFLFLRSLSFGTQDICFCGSFPFGLQHHIAHVFCSPRSMKVQNPFPAGHLSLHILQGGDLHWIFEPYGLYQEVRRFFYVFVVIQLTFLCTRLIMHVNLDWFMMLRLIAS